MTRSVCRCLVLLLVASATVNAANVRGKWICVENRSFRVFTDSRERDAVNLLLNLEQFRRSVGQVIGQDYPISVPIDVYLFRDEASYRPFWPIIGGNKVRVGGYFLSGMPKGRITLQRTWSGDQTTRVVFHEYTHHLTRDFEWPLWLHEGVAEYFSTFRLVRDGVRLGSPIGEHIQLLRERPLIPIDRLVVMEREDVGYRDDLLTGMFYAQSWALFHLLRLGQDPELTDALRRYLVGLQEGEGGLELFHKVFADLSIERRLGQYARQRAWYVHNAKVDIPELERGINRRAVTQPEIHVRLAELLVSGDQIEESRKYLDPARVDDEAPPGWYEVQGVVAIKENRWEDGAEFFRQAVEQDPDYFLNHFYYAWCLRNGAVARDEQTASVTRKTIDLLQNAVNLRPVFLEGFEWLAETALYAGEDLDRGVTAALRGLLLRPSRHGLALTLARLMLAKGDPDSARALLDKVEAVGITVSTRERIESIREEISVRSRWAEQQRLESERWERQEPSGAPAPFERDDDLGEAPLGDRVVSDADRQPGPGRPTEFSPECRPTFADILGKTRVEGTLHEIVCQGNIVVYVIEASGQRLELSAASKTPVIFSCERALQDLSCGPFRAPVVAYFEIGRETHRALAIEVKVEAGEARTRD
jgi:tetratricopeptide (TPR) repeat protein